MPKRKPANPELAKAVDSLSDAAHHVRNAVQGKVDQVRVAAGAELAKAKASARKKTILAHERVETILNQAESRLHRLIAKAQKALDKMVRQAEKKYPAPKPQAAAKKATPSAAVRKTPARKAAAKNAAPAIRPDVDRTTG